MGDISLQERYVHGMVLSGVGDALGYYNGLWEFCLSGEKIYKQLMELGGLDKLHICLPEWMVSDDTVMHLATGEALLSHGHSLDMEKLFSEIAAAFKKGMLDMQGRAPGSNSISGVEKLKPSEPFGYRTPFKSGARSCGAAMRAMCIGLRYPRPDQLKDLIAVSVESGRMTHHHPTGYLGSLASALFTSYAVQDKPMISWGKGLLDTLPQALDYIRSTDYCVKESEEAWGYFTKKWEKYVELRNLESGEMPPAFPENYGFIERDAFVQSVSLCGWGGASGHDAPMIAYDALLGANGNWHELCNRGMFHGGDSDSTGVIAACWFGVMYSIENVPVLNHKDVEYRDRFERIGKGLYALAFTEDGKSVSKDPPGEKPHQCHCG